MLTSRGAVRLHWEGCLESYLKTTRWCPALTSTRAQSISHFPWVEMLIVCRPPGRKRGLPRLFNGKAGDTGDLGLISGLGRSLGEGNGNSVQYFSPENSMDRGAWQAIVHGVAKSWTQLSNWAHMHTYRKRERCQELKRKMLSAKPDHWGKGLELDWDDRTRRKNKVTLEQFVFFNYSVEKAKQSKSYRVKGVNKATFPFVVAKRTHLMTMKT